MVDNLPSALQELTTSLEADGFSVIAEKADEVHLGNRLIELADPTRETGGAVRLVQDRGLWSVEIAVGGKWRDPYQVMLALNESPYSTRAVSHEERLSLTLEAVDRMPPVSSIQPVIQRLEDFDREYWRRLGVREPDLEE